MPSNAGTTNARTNPTPIPSPHLLGLVHVGMAHLSKKMYPAAHAPGTVTLRWFFDVVIIVVYIVNHYTRAIGKHHVNTTMLWSLLGQFLDQKSPVR